MFEKILGWLAAFVIGVISATGYWGVALLMAIESACIPLPSELIMPFAGYLVSTGQFDLFAAATAGAIGCNLGSVVAYEAGKRGGRPFVERWGRYLLIGANELDAADRFFARWGPAAVLVGRLLPFHVYTFVGSWPFCFALAWVGMTLGDKWNSDPRLRAAFHQADAVIGVLLLGAAGLYVWHRVRGIRRNRA